MPGGMTEGSVDGQCLEEGMKDRWMDRPTDLT